MDRTRVRARVRTFGEYCDLRHGKQRARLAQGTEHACACALAGVATNADAGLMDYEPMDDALEGINLHVARGTGESSKPARSAWRRAGARLIPGRALLFGQFALTMSRRRCGVHPPRTLA